MEPNGITMNGASKKIRAPGELQEIIGAALKKKSTMTPVEVAALVGISVANARMSMARYKKNKKAKAEPRRRSRKKAPVISPDSAVARLFNGKEPELTDAEKRFIALISYVGVERAFVLLETETRRLSVLSSTAPGWLLAFASIST